MEAGDREEKRGRWWFQVMVEYFLVIRMQLERGDRVSARLWQSVEYWLVIERNRKYDGERSGRWVVPGCGRVLADHRAWG